MAKTIQQLQQDLAAFRAQRDGSSATPAAPAPVQQPVPTTTADNTTNESIGASLEAFRKDRSAGKTAIPKEPGALASFAKSLFSAPATIVARPFQAAAELAGAKDTQVDAFTKKIPLVGGLIAPVDQNFGDVEKDVGRGIQTVALGTGAPIAGGAAFGVGASLEQGNDLLSAQTAVDAALGAGGGKVLDWLGKPLLNAAGKVVGTITPKIVKDVAAGGADAIAKFAATHDLPLVSPITKPVAAGIERGAQGVDAAIGGAFKKGGQAVKDVAASQFPQLSPLEHYKTVNQSDLVKPTTENNPAYAKATDIFNQAKAAGIDLGEVATKRGIRHDDLMGDGKYNTKETVDQLRQKNYTDANEVLRPAIKQIEPGVRLVPISEVRDELISRVPKNLDDEDRKTIINKITKKYSSGSASDIAHPNGYSLTDLHDARIAGEQKGKFVPGVSTPPAVLSAKLARVEGSTFKQLFDDAVPKRATINGEVVENPLQGVRREFEANFRLADYLKSLHGKRVPEGVAKKAVRLFGRGLGGVLGSKVGGFPGFLVGSRGGDMLFSAFETLPNPLKRAVLNGLKDERSPVFEALAKYLHDTKQDALLMKLLPAAGKSSYKELAPTLFTTPGGRSTPIKGEAFDLTAVEQGRAKTPGTNRRLSSYLKKVDQAQQNPSYTPPNELPVIKAGRVPKAPKRLNDIL